MTSLEKGEVIICPYTGLHVCVIVCNCVCARAYGVQSYLSIYLFIEVFKFCTSTNIVAEPPPEGRKKKRLCAVDQVRCISRKVA